MFRARLLAASSSRRRLLADLLPSLSAAAFSTAASPKRPIASRRKLPQLPLEASPELSLGAEWKEEMAKFRVGAEREEETVKLPPEAADGREGWEREKPRSEPQRPPTMPFQTKVANAVRLVGTIAAPVQLQRLKDGRFNAVSMLVQDKRSGFPKFWIPVIFQDDLAQMAAAYLQENDLVYVSGQLTSDVPPVILGDGQADIQVLVHLVSYVDDKATQVDKQILFEEKDVMECETNIVKAEKDVMVAEKKTWNSIPRTPGTVSGYKDKNDKLKKLWADVVANPDQWMDYRADKQNGSKKHNYPDFKNKVSKEPLWLNTAPKLVLAELDDLVFNNGHNAVKNEKVPSWNDNKEGTYVREMKFVEGRNDSAASKGNHEENLWRSLCVNPRKWWDNRSNKKSAKSPDFKHKETGEPLWIGSKTPKWAMDALPPVAAQGEKGKAETLLS